MNRRLGPEVAWTVLWLVLMAAALASRPPLPVDETRYLAVAWDMWLRGDFLVPHLNGKPYSDKPPLLFWLMQAGWAVLGVNDWWPRLVAPLTGLAGLFLTAALGRQLWPETKQEIAATAPFLVLGMGFWTLFATLTMFDMMLACFALLGLLGVVRAVREGGWHGWALLVAGIALGVLAKGPAILLHILPAALSAPLWADRPAGGWKRWYASVIGAALAGAAVALLWAIPAGMRGGQAYRDAIFWGQTAGRMVDSFAHVRPVWWYLAILPGLMLPLILWPPLWRAVAAGRGLLADRGFRLCLIWFGTAFLAFSLISGKQLHYLLPEFPALALILARALIQVPDKDRGRDHAVPALAAALVGGGLFMVAQGIVKVLPPEYDGHLDPFWGLALMATGLILAWLMPATRSVRVGLIAATATAAVVAVHLSARPLLEQAFDLKPLALRLAAWEAEGVPLANYGKYHGQFHFLGRLTKPLGIVGDQEIAAWIDLHPNGKIVTYREEDLPADIEPEAIHPFRSKLITVWDAAKIRANPDLAKRPSE